MAKNYVDLTFSKYCDLKKAIHTNVRENTYWEACWLNTICFLVIFVFANFKLLATVCIPTALIRVWVVFKTYLPDGLQIYIVDSV